MFGKRCWLAPRCRRPRSCPNPAGRRADLLPGKDACPLGKPKERIAQTEIADAPRPLAATPPAVRGCPPTAFFGPARRRPALFQPSSVRRWTTLGFTQPGRPRMRGGYARPLACRTPSRAAWREAATRLLSTAGLPGLQSNLLVLRSAAPASILSHVPPGRPGAPARSSRRHRAGHCSGCHAAPRAACAPLGPDWRRKLGKLPACARARVFRPAKLAGQWANGAKNEERAYTCCPIICPEEIHKRRVRGREPPDGALWIRHKLWTLPSEGSRPRLDWVRNEL
jgi:hypothetical protein